MPHIFTDYTPPTVNEIFTAEFKAQIIDQKARGFSAWVLKHMQDDGWDRYSEGEQLKFGYDCTSSLAAGIVRNSRQLGYHLGNTVLKEIIKLYDRDPEAIPGSINEVTLERTSTNSVFYYWEIVQVYKSPPEYEN